MVQHLSQSEFPASVYQAKQQKLHESRVMLFLTEANWCLSSCCYHLSQFQFPVPRNL